MDNQMLLKAQEHYTYAKQQYEKQIQNMDDNEAAYLGTRPIKDSKGNDAKTQYSIVRKLVFELIESQVDVVIPMPRVISLKGREDRAKMIEGLIRNTLDRLPFEKIIDQQSRLTPILGGSIFFTEWDNQKYQHGYNGDLNVKNIHPKQVIPQPGVYDVYEMDEMFAVFEQTKQYVKDVYGVDVKNEDDQIENGQPYEHMCTHVFWYYKNKDGSIGLFSYVGDTPVQDYENYFARHMEVCVKCNEPVDSEGKCPKCKKDKTKSVIKQKQTIEVTNQQTGEIESVEIPYYKLDQFPFVVRPNVSLLNSFLGGSDVDYVKDHQNETTILKNKIKKKILKGGSIVTMSDKTLYDASDDELQIVKFTDPAEKQLFGVQSVQPDIVKDQQLCEQDYLEARQTLGITNSYQGREDTTATSGKAKQISAAQTAGRLNSKKVMKDFAFSELYKLIFKFSLAFEDNPRPYTSVNENGETNYNYFDKRMFIDQDENGEFYYDDEFVFSTDQSGTLANDRQAMWQETRSNFESGAYGPPQDMATLITYWQTMEQLHYPGADQALSKLNERMIQQQQAAQLAAQQQAAIEQPVDNTPDVVNATLNSIGG